MTAPFLFCQQVIPAMIRQGGGSIVNVSSNTALFGNTGISSYGPAKAGMISFTKHLAVACGPHGIRANSLTPARMLTEKKLAMLDNNAAEVRRQQHLYPLGNPALPEQVAEVLLFLASDESAGRYRPQPDRRSRRSRNQLRRGGGTARSRHPQPFGGAGIGLDRG